MAGWYKFARDADQALRLLGLFLDNSKPSKKPSPPDEEQKADAEQKDKAVEQDLTTDPAVEASYLEKLLTTHHTFSPLELFHLRFFHYPPSFYRYESLQRSKVQLSLVMLDSEHLLRPVVINGQDAARLLAKPEEEEKKEE